MDAIAAALSAQLIMMLSWSSMLHSKNSAVARRRHHVIGKFHDWAGTSFSRHDELRRLSIPRVMFQISTEARIGSVPYFAALVASSRIAIPSACRVAVGVTAISGR